MGGVTILAASGKPRRRLSIDAQAASPQAPNKKTIVRGITGCLARAPTSRIAYVRRHYKKAYVYIVGSPSGERAG
jgi:hypothetical protein